MSNGRFIEKLSLVTDMRVGSLYNVSVFMERISCVGKVLAAVFNTKVETCQVSKR